MKLLLGDIQTIIMIVNIEGEDPSVIIVTSQDMSKKIAGRFMANLLMGSHQDQQMIKTYVQTMLPQMTTEIRSPIY
jgi:hypothetical protein